MGAILPAPHAPAFTANKILEKHMAESKPICFVVMPISDMTGYDPGHFGRVYEYVIKKACAKAGFDPVRADDVKKSDVIIVEVLKKMMSAEMVLCDLSGRNPNVLYELGMRQAFNKPAALIKDDLTKDVFDISAIRYLTYESSLRIDAVVKAVDDIANFIKETYDARDSSANSLLQLMSISAAKLERDNVSSDTALIINSIATLSGNLRQMEERISRLSIAGPTLIYPNPAGAVFSSAAGFARTIIADDGSGGVLPASSSALNPRTAAFSTSTGVPLPLAEEQRPAATAAKSKKDSG
jgi:hypothetical protein